MSMRVLGQADGGRPRGNACEILGGQRGIRTPDTLLTYTRFPGVRLQPLGHPSKFINLMHYTKETFKTQGEGFT